MLEKFSFVLESNDCSWKASVVVSSNEKTFQLHNFQLHFLHSTNNIRLSPTKLIHQMWHNMASGTKIFRLRSSC